MIPEDQKNLYVNLLSFDWRALQQGIILKWFNFFKFGLTEMSKAFGV